jgi:two-component system OmpR family response regulator
VEYQLAPSHTLVTIAEGNPNLASLLGWHLRQLRYRVCQANDLEQAKLVYRRYQPDILVLSTELGAGYGDFCRLVHDDRHTLILLTGTRPHEQDIVAGLKAGGDDYLVKPFGIQEFLARIEALQRRLRILPRTPDLVSIGALQLDLVQRTAKLRGQPLSLTPQEFSLLCALVHTEGKPLTRAELLQKAWSGQIHTQRTVDSHIQSLRKKLEPDPRHPQIIVTVRNLGYALNPELLMRLPPA